MDRQHRRRPERRRRRYPTALADPHVLTEDRAASGRAHQAQGPGPDHGDLLPDPGGAGSQMGEVRLAMDPLLPAVLVTEVLHGVREVDVVALDTQGLEGPVEDPTGGSHQRVTPAVLPVAPPLP